MLDTWSSRGFLSNLTRPFARQLIKRGISANQVTWIGLIFGVAIMPALYYHFTTWATVLLILSGYCDALDGTIARITNTDSPKGAVLDILFDRIVEWSIIIGLFLAYPDRALCCLSILGAILFCTTSFLVVGIFTPNASLKSFHNSPGLVERAEAFGFFMAMIIFPSLFEYLAILFVLLTMLTALVRVIEFQRFSK
ncbi:MAG: CDP-alcohol phosphatidyltransferase family protein [Parachlamydiales bacterium]|nr:CDP-alcohol phosphatidyltransferase family protein [Parachlamydiales bacterium]